MGQLAAMRDYKELSFKISEAVTRKYSTSFYTATSLFPKEIRKAIFSIYGFVRLADEIVDSFHEFDKETLINKFEEDYKDALAKGISLNPVLYSFQQTVSQYQIPDDYVNAFLSSMKKDLFIQKYRNEKEADEYIYGSADVVGLMCLKVFCIGNDLLFAELQEPAANLGSAFQKVNFLRDLKNDTEVLNRQYFPTIESRQLDEATKNVIIKDIEEDFAKARIGIKKLPRSSKLAVTVAYLYYTALLRKLKKTPARSILNQRIRISPARKMQLLTQAFVTHKLDLL